MRHIKTVCAVNVHAAAHVTKLQLLTDTTEPLVATEVAGHTCSQKRRTEIELFQHR
jgi:hypothetical protein